MEQKNKLLGMPFGTAMARLRKAILFQLVQETNRDICFRCGKIIDSIDNISIEHKEGWQLTADPVKSFFDLDNIAFSHLICNVSKSTGRKGMITAKHGSKTMYSFYKCRCDKCREAYSIYQKRYR